MSETDKKATPPASAPFTGMQLLLKTACLIGGPLFVLFLTNWIVALGVAILFVFFGHEQYKLLFSSLKASRNRAQAAIGYESSDEDPDTDEGNRKDEDSAPGKKSELDISTGLEVAKRLGIIGEVNKKHFARAFTLRDTDGMAFRQVCDTLLNEEQHAALYKYMSDQMRQLGFTPQAAPVINSEHSGDPASDSGLPVTLPDNVAVLPTVDNVDAQTPTSRPTGPFSALPDGTRSMRVTPRRQNGSDGGSTSS